MKHRIFSIAIFFCLLAGEGYGQDGNCNKCQSQNGQVFIIDPVEARGYVQKFDDFYIDNESDRQLHSISTEFSREAFLEFYKANFETHPEKYSGMNVCPVSYDVPRRAGQKTDNQMGMVLAPRGLDCKTDPNGYICGNNSFDGNLGSASRTPITYSGEELTRFSLKFEKEFKDGWFSFSKLYSRKIYLDIRVCKFLATYLRDNSNADGFAIFPAAYGEKRNDVCGHKRKKQMTLVIVAIVDGQVNYDALKKYYDSKSAIDKSFMAVNHGSLCPDVCY